MNLDDFPLSKKGLKKLYHEYESMDLLQAVDALDKIRCITGDQENFKPPQIRFDLMDMHNHIFNLIRQGHRLNKEEREQLSDLLESVENDVDTIIENAEKILKIIRPLIHDLFASDEDKDHVTGLSDLKDEDWFNDDDNEEE